LNCSRGVGTRERERKNYDRGNEIITVGNKSKKKSKGYQRQGNERVELALGYKAKEENFLCYSPLRERAPHHNAESLGPLIKKKMFDILIHPKARIKNLR
jgi:hypothetical protein